MKKLSSILICAQMFMGVLFYFVSTGAASADTCGATYVAGYTEVVTSGGQSGACTFTPELLKVSVYKFGLCQTKPSYSDYKDCIFFQNSSTPASVTVSQGTAMELAGNATLETGTYSYLVQLWDSSIAFKFTHPVFTTGQYGADNVQGQYCYSNGKVKPDDPTDAINRNVTCTTSASAASASAAISVQNISPLGGNSPFNAITNVPSVSGNFDAQLLSDPVTLAGISFAQKGSNPNSYEMTSDANYLFSVLTMSTPVTITDNTNSVKLEVLLDNSFTQESYFTAGNDYCNGGSGTSGSKYCLGNAQLSTLGFKFTVN